MGLCRTYRYTQVHGVSRTFIRGKYGVLSSASATPYLSAEALLQTLGILNRRNTRCRV
ncbi:hypothetical protein HNP40_004107 [Mycobacteroides chelonae]|nr:hypothetical protein [Mycobacteroides chelonae]